MRDNRYAAVLAAKTKIKKTAQSSHESELYAARSSEKFSFLDAGT